jgi:hypothetical protein
VVQRATARDGSKDSGQTSEYLNARFMAAVRDIECKRDICGNVDRDVHRTNAACLAEPDDALNWLALESCACPLPSAANASRVSGSGVVSPLAIVIKN